MAGSAARYSNKVLRISNIAWTVGRKELKNYFSKFGEVSFAYISFDKNTGLSKHFGMIRFKDDKVAEKVLQETEHVLEGKKLILMSEQKIVKEQ